MPKLPKTAERPKSAPPLPDFVDDAYYRVQLRRSVRYAGRSFSPSASSRRASLGCPSIVDVKKGFPRERDSLFAERIALCPFA